MGFRDGDGCGEGVEAQLGTPGTRTGDLVFSSRYGGGDTDETGNGRGRPYEVDVQTGCGDYWDL